MIVLTLERPEDLIVPIDGRVARGARLVGETLVAVALALHAGVQLRERLVADAALH